MPTTTSRPSKRSIRSAPAIKAIRAMLPKTTVRTKTIAPDGKVVYEDEREVQESRIPIYEGMLHTQTLAPSSPIGVTRWRSPVSRLSSRKGSPQKPLPISTRSNGS